jgi:hypothetical protein
MCRWSKANGKPHVRRKPHQLIRVSPPRLEQLERRIMHPSTLLAAAQQVCMISGLYRHPTHWHTLAVTRLVDLGRCGACVTFAAYQVTQS